MRGRLMIPPNGCTATTLMMKTENCGLLPAGDTAREATASAATKAGASARKITALTTVLSISVIYTITIRTTRAATVPDDRLETVAVYRNAGTELINTLKFGYDELGRVKSRKVLSPSGTELLEESYGYAARKAMDVCNNLCNSGSTNYHVDIAAQMQKRDLHRIRRL